MAFEDSLRAQSAAAVAALRSGAWAGGGRAAVPRRVVMLTGDNAAAAARVAAALGIDDVRASLGPEAKLAAVEALRAWPAVLGAPGGATPRGRGVMMVGDGLNDAAALAAADVGVAIAGARAGASGAASLAADVVVAAGAGGAAAVPLLLRLAAATRAAVAQNLALAAGAILALALPAALGAVPLWAAVALHEGSTLLVALNSLRLLRFAAPPRRAADVSGGAERAAPAAPAPS
jgi:P-type E1-E2 ATPase